MGLFDMGNNSFSSDFSTESEGSPWDKIKNSQDEEVSQSELTGKQTLYQSQSLSSIEDFIKNATEQEISNLKSLITKHHGNWEVESFSDYECVIIGNGDILEIDDVSEVGDTDQWTYFEIILSRKLASTKGKILNLKNIVGKTMTFTDDEESYKVDGIVFRGNYVTLITHIIDYNGN